MSTISPDSYKKPLSYEEYSNYLNNNKKSKAIDRKPIFESFLEGSSNIVQNLQDFYTSSIPITNSNNNSSFENSMNGTYMVDYHTKNIFLTSLELYYLSIVFEIQLLKIVDNYNSNKIFI